MQEGRKDSLEMKIRVWKDISCLLLLSVSNEEDSVTASHPALHPANSPIGMLQSGCKHLCSLLIFANSRNF